MARLRARWRQQRTAKGKSQVQQQRGVDATRKQPHTARPRRARAGCSTHRCDARGAGNACREGDCHWENRSVRQRACISNSGVVLGMSVLLP